MLVAQISDPTGSVGTKKPLRAVAQLSGPLKSTSQIHRGVPGLKHRAPPRTRGTFSSLTRCHKAMKNLQDACDNLTSPQSLRNNKTRNDVSQELIPKLSEFI